MIDIRVENDPKSESHLSMHMAIVGYKLVSRIDRGIRNTVSRLVKEGDL